jgi:hypothetical protein
MRGHIEQRKWCRINPTRGGKELVPIKGSWGSWLGGLEEIRQRASVSKRLAWFEGM